jgi:hypothetical protein
VLPSTGARGISDFSHSLFLSVGFQEQVFLCAASVFSVSLWWVFWLSKFTTETQRTPRLHREKRQSNIFPIECPSCRSEPSTHFPWVGFQLFVQSCEGGMAPSPRWPQFIPTLKQRAARSCLELNVRAASSPTVPLRPRDAPQLWECDGIENASPLHRNRKCARAMQPCVLTIKIEASLQRTKESSQKSGKFFVFEIQSFSTSIIRNSYAKVPVE